MGSSMPDDYHQCGQRFIRFHKSEALPTFPQKTDLSVNVSERAVFMLHIIPPAYQYWRSHVSLLP